ncbi:hypothetical protein M752DRAFT_148792 [Aspergillus phoenicis ATCC 13157]|uniref:Uncharacterized protein n=1 Tax=Aspergillus phoenicis ATCC 13157 TaxID=1353007 RepID=A0A370PP99_ASPPH|nr:hypothetical protein M752DRAFT_148792 [Aspergillus phoenicis ATCC 13157]
MWILHIPLFTTLFLLSLYFSLFLSLLSIALPSVPLSPFSQCINKSSISQSRKRNHQSFPSDREVPLAIGADQELGAPTTTNETPSRLPRVQKKDLFSALLRRCCRRSVSSSSWMLGADSPCPSSIYC